MLSYNFHITRKSILGKIPIHSVLLVFLIFYIDFYDMSLYIGYMIYLKPVLLPNSYLYDYIPYISGGFLFAQFIKFLGFILSYYFVKDKFTSDLPFIGQILIFALFISLPSYSQVGDLAIVLFVILRFFLTFFFGMQIAYAVKVLSKEGAKFNDKLPFYSFIILSSEVGIVVAIFFNRLLVSHGVSFYHLETAIRIQIMVNMLLLYVCYRIKQRVSFNDSHGVVYRRKELWYVIRKHYKYIFLRTSIISYSVLLIVFLIRVPNTMHLFWGMSVLQVNRIILYITLMGFAGSFLVNYLKKYIPVRKIILGLYFISLVENFWYLYTNSLFVAEYNHIWLYSIGFLYGAFLRITPLVSYDIQDFDKRNQILGRLLSYLMAYVFVGSLALFCLDLSYYIFKDIRLPSMLYILVFVACVGIFGLFKHGKYQSS